VSRDGRTLALIEHIVVEPVISRLHVSRDGGTTWTQEMIPARSAGLAITPAGNRVYCVAGDTLLGRNTDETSWEPLTEPGLRPVAPGLSEDGEQLYAVQAVPGSDLGRIIQSSDGGRTWRWSGAPDASWKALACTADGAIAYAVSERGLFRSPAQPGATTASPAGRATVSQAGVRFEWIGKPHRTYSLARAKALAVEGWHPDGALVADGEGRIELAAPAECSHSFWKLLE
jgi:photosystem II stability/assembly factor-like uncharacterized protein